MTISTLLQRKNLPTLFGFFLFVTLMAAGYYYNLTFIQLGLEDFGSRSLGLSSSSSARDMAFLAVSTCLIALGFGWWMARRGLSRKFRFKLQAAFGVVLAQTLLTAVLPAVGNETMYLIWLFFTSCGLGIGVPITFSLTVDLVPVRQRGAAAALITSLSYFAAETLSSQWTFEFFRSRSLWLLGVGSLGMGLLAFIDHPWLDALGKQQSEPAFSRGRFVPVPKNQKPKAQRGVLRYVILMFAVYFIDSLGFLRLLKVPGFMEITWQSSLLSDRLFIAGVHVLGALIAGVMYTTLPERELFFWIFGLFALTHLQYSLHLQVTGNTLATLATPMLYALAVSLYTVVNFAVWADLSNPATISLNAAVGVAFSAWTATFLSTGLAIFWEGMGISLTRHIQIVNGLAMLLFTALLIIAFFTKSERTV
jgi:MFS family permease